MDDKNLKTVLSLFPYLRDEMKATKLKIDKDSIHLISARNYAKEISKIIDYNLKRINIDPKNATITDATAGVGGNTLSFAMFFNKINAIEIDKKRYEYLKNNTEVFNLNNINFFNDDSIKILNTFENHDVVFIDPPWGGKNYKKHKSLKLKLSKVPLEILVNCIFDSSWMKKVPSLVVLKLPTNYNILHLFRNVYSNRIYFYDLKKIFILVIINPNI